MTNHPPHGPGDDGGESWEVRRGAALLVGLLTCGRCRSPMRLTYKPRRRYICTFPGCGEPDSRAAIDVTALDSQVIAAFFTALAPHQLDALADQATESERAASLGAGPRVYEAPPALSLTMSHHLRLIGRALPRAWREGRLEPAEQRALLQTMIWRVIVQHAGPDGAVAKVVWTSGAITTLPLPEGASSDQPHP